MKKFRSHPNSPIWWNAYINNVIEREKVPKKVDCDLLVAPPTRKITVIR